MASIKEILQRSKVIAVVGLSDRPDRPSYDVASYLQRQGYRIVPVNPRLGGPVLGEQPYPDLESVPFRVDVVDVFRRAEEVPAVVDSAIRIGAPAVWMQLGVVNDAAAAKARAAGLDVVMDRCMKIEHSALVRQGTLPERK